MPEPGRPVPDIEDAGRHVPGSCVGPVDPLATFRLLPGLIFSSPGPLGTFAKSSLRRPCPPHDGGESYTAPRAVWPVPLPYVEVTKVNPFCISDGDLRKVAVNAAVILLNFLTLGKPSRAPSTCLGGRPLSRDQSKHVERLGSFFDAWFSLGTLTASEMGRTAGKIEDLERVLQMLGNFRGNASDCGELGWLRGAKVGAFKEVESKRLKFRGFPVFDPCPFLDENSRAIYLHPLQHSTPPESFEGRVPRVRVHCSREERLLLYQLLDRSNRIKPFSKDQVRVGFGSGVFAVLKSLEADRLILDSRPHNLLEAPPGRFIRTLGSADPILQLHLTQEENIYISSNDIRDFYHLFRVSDERCRRNSLVATVRPHEVSGFKSFQKWMYGHSELYVGLACLAMGDTQAVELAQSCHLGICLQHDIIQADNLVAMNLPPPRRRTMAGIVIDDFVSLSIESRKPEEIAACPSEACRLADKTFGIYKKVKLIPHEEKSVRDELRADFWGLSLDGELGLARGFLKRAAPLMKVICAPGWLLHDWAFGGARRRVDCFVHLQTAPSLSA